MSKVTVKNLKNNKSDKTGKGTNLYYKYLLYKDTIDRN